MFRHFLVIPAVLISASAQAATSTFQCQGVDYTRGSLELKINTQTASVKGTYHFEIEGEKPGQAVTLACTGSLDNYGKPGTDKRDYFEVKRTATCTIGYIRTSKDMVSRNVGYISLVVRGPSDHDAPGYEYANFRCQ